MNAYTEKELFETVSVPRAVVTLAIPTVISQLVTMIYNLADTFYRADRQPLYGGGSIACFAVIQPFDRAWNSF